MIQNNLLITIHVYTGTCINTCIININDLEHNYFLKQLVCLIDIISIMFLNLNKKVHSVISKYM